MELLSWENKDTKSSLVSCCYLTIQEDYENLNNLLSSSENPCPQETKDDGNNLLQINVEMSLIGMYLIKATGI